MNVEVMHIRTVRNALWKVYKRSSKNPFTNTSDTEIKKYLPWEIALERASPEFWSSYTDAYNLLMKANVEQANIFRVALSLCTGCIFYAAEQQLPCFAKHKTAETIMVCAITPPLELYDSVLRDTQFFGIRLKFIIDAYLNAVEVHTITLIMFAAHAKAFMMQFLWPKTSLNNLNLN